MNRVQRLFVVDALKQINKLNDWDCRFIQSLHEQDKVDPDKELTEKQNKILNRIQRYTSSGGPYVFEASDNRQDGFSRNDF